MPTLLNNPPRADLRARERAARVDRPASYSASARPLDDHSVDHRLVGRGRRVVVLAVHHVRVDGQTLTGGAEKHVRLVVGGLMAAGAGVHVAYSGDCIYDDLWSAHDGEQLTLERTNWINDALSGDGRLSPATVISRMRWLRKVGVDTVYAVQQAAGGAFVASLAAARLLGLRVVSSIRQSPDPRPSEIGGASPLAVIRPQLWRRRPIWRRRIAARCCDAVIFNSRRVADAYVRECGFPAARCRVVPNGETPRPDRTPTDRPRRIAAVGRVTEPKGADVLIEAFALLAPRFSDAELTYYGDGPLIEPLRARARRLDLANRITFAGYQADHDALYAGIDVLVQPSRRESMSNSVIEAMARGIPCVVTDVGGLPEAVQDGVTGRVVPVDRPDRCAAAIERLLTDREMYRRLSAAAQQRARVHFNGPRLLRNTVTAILGTGEAEYH